MQLLFSSTLFPPEQELHDAGPVSVLFTAVSQETSVMPRNVRCSLSIFRVKEESNKGRAIISVVPTVNISTHHVPSLQAVILICHVQRFYPDGIQITWLQRNRWSRTCESFAPTKNPDGTLSQDCHILLNASEDQSLFTCQVELEAQTLVQASVQLSEFREVQASLGE